MYIWYYRLVTKRQWIKVAVSGLKYIGALDLLKSLVAPQRKEVACDVATKLIKLVYSIRDPLVVLFKPKTVVEPVATVHV